MVLQDDTFVRTDKLRSYLKAIDPSEPVVATLHQNRVIGFTTRRRREDFVCNENNPSNYYPVGSFVAYSRGALHRIIHSLNVGGLLQQAINSRVPNDEKGMETAVQIFHWMFALPVIVLPFALENTTSLIWWDKDQKNNPWKESDVAGMIDSSGKPMQEWDTHFRGVSNAESKNAAERVPIVWKNSTGFKHTTTFRDHGCPTTWGGVWYNFTPQMCQEKVVK